MLIECPWCGDDAEIETGDLFGDGTQNEAETDCDKCGKPMTVYIDFYCRAEKAVEEDDERINADEWE